MSEPYLRSNPPARPQFRSPRRQRPTGLICLHTAENVMDTVGPDTGAENVARFIRDRSTPGSYHDVADSDSNLLLVGYGDEAYQDGTGSNPFALSISFALAAADWSRLSSVKRAAFLHQGAVAFARQQKWLATRGYPATPLRRVTRAQSAHGEPGFISHGERDPGRRTDPGADFPWTEWFDACRTTTGRPTPMPAPIPPAEDEMKLYVFTHQGLDWGTDLVTRRPFEDQTVKATWIGLAQRLGHRVERVTLTADEIESLPAVGAGL